MTSVQHISDDELAEIYTFAVQLGKDAGAILMNFARARWSDQGDGEQVITEKDSSVDIVTKADEGSLLNSTLGPPWVKLTSQKDVEAFIKSAIEKKYPTHK